MWLLQPDMALEPAESESLGKSKHTDLLQISAVHVTSLDTTFVWSQSFIYFDTWSCLGLVHYGLELILKSRQADPDVVS